MAMTHLSTLLALKGLQSCVRPHMLQQLLTTAQDLSTHGACVEEFLRRWLRSWFVCETICESCLMVDWRWCRFIVLVVVARELVVILKVVDELIDIEIFKSNCRTRENQNKNKSHLGWSRNSSSYGNKSWISGSTFISTGSSFPFISCEALVLIDNVIIGGFFDISYFPSLTRGALSEGILVEGKASGAKLKIELWMLRVWNRLNIN